VKLIPKTRTDQAIKRRFIIIKSGGAAML